MKIRQDLWIFIYIINSSLNLGFPCVSNGKVSACNAGDGGSIPGLVRSPGKGNGNPLQYSCLENSMDKGVWWATVHGVTKSQTWLTSSHTHTHIPKTCSEQAWCCWDLTHELRAPSRKKSRKKMVLVLSGHLGMDTKLQILSGDLRALMVISLCHSLGSRFFFSQCFILNVFLMKCHFPQKDRLYVNILLREDSGS